MKDFEKDIVRLTEVIICTKKRRGEGIPEDPIRVITEVFSTDGELIAEYDPIIINRL